MWILFSFVLIGAEQLPVRDQLLWEIGASLHDERVSFGRVSDAAIHRDQIYVVDSGLAEIKLFDLEGNFVRTFGQPGRGPAEFHTPTGIAVDTFVHVFDPALQRVTRFSLDGEYVASSRYNVPLPTNAVRVYHMRGELKLVHLLATFSPGRPEHQPNEVLLALRAGGTVDTIARFHSGAVLYHPRGRVLPWGIVQSDLGRGGAWAVLGDSIFAVADGQSGRVQRFFVRADGTYVQADVIELGVSAEATDKDDEIRALRQVEREKRRATRGFVVELPLYRSAATKAVFSPDGRLWVQGPNRGSSTLAFAVPSKGGEPLAVTIPGRVKLLAADSNHLLAAVEAEDGSIRLRLYRVSN